MPVAGAIAGAGVLSAGASMYGASSAADAQTAAADQANAAQMKMFNTTQANLKPYMDAGQTGVNMLQDRIGSISAPVTMDAATLRNTPGYQFNLSQGLKSTQSAAAARGLGVSGAAMKGASSYATGLADSTYQNQFSNAMANKQNALTSLVGLSNIGESAAAGVGNAATATGQGIAANTIGAGNAQGAASLYGASAVSSAGNSFANNYLLSSIFNKGSGGFTNTANGWPVPGFNN